MLSYRRSSYSGWVACGPVGEVQVGKVTVTTAAGKNNSEEVAYLGKPFVAEDGQELVYGYLWHDDVAVYRRVMICRKELGCYGLPDEYLVKPPSWMGQPACKFPSLAEAMGWIDTFTTPAPGDEKITLITHTCDCVGGDGEPCDTCDCGADAVDCDDRPHTYEVDEDGGWTDTDCADEDEYLATLDED